MGDHYYWIGAVDGDWENTGNWTGGANFPGHTNADDDVTFSYECDHYPDTNLDRYARAVDPGGNGTSCDFDSLAISSDFIGTIGASGTELIFGADNIYIDCPQAGDIYLKGAHASYKLDKVYVTNAPEANTLYLDGLIVNAYLYKGNVNIVSGTTISGTWLYIGMRDSVADLILTINDTTGSATSLPNVVYCYGGIVENYAAIVSLDLSGGIWTQGNDGENSNVCGSITSNFRQYGGTFYWNRGNLPASYLYNGLFDASNGKSARSYSSFSVFSGTAILRNGTKSISGTVTQKGTGTIILPIGQTATLAGP